MNKLTNLLQDFRDYQSRKVDSPYYEPLGQSIPLQETETITKEELRRAKRRDYQRKYYEEHKEKMKQYMRDYRKRKRTGKEGWLKWVQLAVYNYMVEQYQLWDRVPRATQIAKALNVWEQTVYNATAVLVKKWYIGRWALGKYYLINPPWREEDEPTEELSIMWIDLIGEQPTEKGCMDLLSDAFKSWLIAQNKQLYEENQKLKETLKKIQEAYINFEDEERNFHNAIWTLDAVIMNR